MCHHARVTDDGARPGAPPVVLYVHASSEGAVFVVRGDATQAWVTLAELDAELADLVAQSGAAMVSLEGGADATVEAHALHRRVIGSGAPTRLLPEHHPAVTPLPEGVSRLMAFAHVGRHDLVADLLERGADPRAVDQQGTTALMYAANAGNAEVVRELLARGAPPDARADDGSTALLFASQGGHLDVVNALLVAGADPSLEGPGGLTAMELARETGNDLVVAALRLAGG